MRRVESVMAVAALLILPALAAAQENREAPPPAAPPLFQSDMTRMTGQTAEDPMAGMAMPGWSFMTMGVARLVYNHQGGLSGDETVESSNWVMAMGQHGLGRGRLTLMLMNSLEPATFHRGGSPELFQVGETFAGRPLVDHQHPHDFFMNLSATYRLPVGERAAVWLQAAPRGEPALGPTTFMHRASAGENPTAVLSHHFQDSTHITDDVVTVGAGYGRFTLEGSAFHGQEPDEGRWDLDPGGLDSWSGRLKVRLGGGWSGQVSHGKLHEPEALNPGDVKRTTASLHYGAEGAGPLAVSLVWGRNRESHGTFNGYLLEGAWQATSVDHFYARAEQADRDLDLLVFKGGVPVPRPQPRREAGAAASLLDRRIAVRALTLGYLRDLHRFAAPSWLGPVHVGVGADLTLYQSESLLDATYGEAPLSVHAFLRVRWGTPHGTHGGHAMPGGH